MDAIAPGPRELIVFGGTAGRHLSREVCSILGLEEGGLEVTRFADGETSVKILNNVRGRDCFVIQSTCTPVNDNLIELLLTIDALKRASAHQVGVVIPYFGYARQDRKDQGRVALSAKVVANAIAGAGASRLICIDLHSPQIQGFFDVPVDHLMGAPVLVHDIKERGLAREPMVVVSPDVGNVKRARNYAARLNAPLVIVDKRRPAPNVSEVVNIIGKVRGRTCFIMDDMIDTAGTLCGAAEALVNNGAGEIYACASHAVLSGPAHKRLADSSIRQVIVTNSIEHRGNGGLEKLRVVTMAPLIADAILRIHKNLSVSELFDWPPKDDDEAQAASQG
jgi:ribose-phosphate pyrophosphokinase